ncbi:choloylglycine hydrolase [Staphylococcus simulans]|uniref:choloylglycine hydrolase family protein n=1 Tax=Staphylococcus simulans TaxID=1286 RepID=UPI000D098845|nr:choloylglycine hydrolase family protein [Staphylococcus simulans]AVO03025.1 choloylglycine hydrolase [Staphylococcus simulans]AVO05980.1 choloylglycine hydrolase [Staphylococcus simulans]AWG19573.1 choloylglycine hydrolase [Staphylococcus simulans]AWI02523.1 choloylglycine hydrolase [Staphylococcus simulans]
MCTSFTFTSQYDTTYLARTMDFAFELKAFPKVIPRNYQWETTYGQTFTFDYGFVGSAMKIDDVMFADGINEKGLSIAILNNNGFATYKPAPASHHINLGPESFIMWLLGTNASISQLKETIGSVRLIDEQNPVLGKTPAFHFIVTDQTGQSIVLVPNGGKLILKDNPVQVLTNHPDLEWHYQNLQQYTAFNTDSSASITLGDKQVDPIHVETNTEILPGGYTSPARFVKTAYFRQMIEDAEDDTMRLNNLFKLLDTVSIPRGIVLHEGQPHYTQYQCILDCEHLTYYYKDYNSSDIYTIQLTDVLLDSKEEKTYEIKPQLNLKDITLSQHDSHHDEGAD